MTARTDYDVVIVGASLAGCTATILLARSGAQVALVEQRPDLKAYKRICTHFIQSSGIRPLQRIGLLEPMMQAGACARVPASGHALVGSSLLPTAPCRVE